MPKLDPYHRPKAPPARVKIAMDAAPVLASFRDEIHVAAHRAGMTIAEFALWSAAERLQRAGRSFAGLFEPGDMPAEDV
jgi:hypothetical protein